MKSRQSIAAMTDTKTCSRCGEVKPLADFHPRSDARDGRKSHCRRCDYQRRNARRKKHPEQVKAYNEKYRLQESVRCMTARPLAILNQFDYGPPLSKPAPGTVRRYMLLTGKRT